MKKSKKFALLTGAIVGATAIAAHVMKKKAEKTTYEADLIEPIEKRKMGFYEKYGKRILDIACATAAIVVFSPLYLGVAALVKLKLGNPVLFTQDRPGLIGKDGKETVFKMYKFRTMTDERDENGELLPDDVRLTKFGKWLRNTSLDELPEAFNILNGTMSVIGPRPQLVRDMTFMTKEQRARHTAKPGLSGLAQVNGRNGISWEEKLDWEAIKTHIEAALTRVKNIITGYLMMVVGVLLCCSGVGIPLGVGLIIEGVRAIKSDEALDWEKMKNEIQVTMETVKMYLLNAGAIVVGILLCVTGVSLPLGLALILSGIKAFKTGETINSDLILNTVMCSKKNGGAESLTV